MKRPIVFFLLAGFAAVLASMVVYSALKKKDAEVEKAMVKSTQVLVAARDLPLGARIDGGAVKLVRWPKDNLPAGATMDARAVTGTIVKTAFVANEPIVTSKLFVGDKTSGVLPLLIPAGMRAMSVPVDEVSDIAGFVLPHSKVDVLVAIAAPHGSNPGGGDNRSKIVLENVEVLAVAQTIEGKQDEPQVVKVVTLLVTPEEAERLALASREGTLRLAMRNYNDDKIVLTSGTDVQGVLRAFSSVPAPVVQVKHWSGIAAPAPRPFEIEIMRNGQTREAVGFTRGAAVKSKANAPSEAAAPPAAEHDKTTVGSSEPTVAPPAGFGPNGKTIDIQ